MIDVKAKARQVYEQGFCVLESLFGERERRETAAILRGVWEQRGKPALTGFGMGIHPMFEHAPAIAPYYYNPEVIDVLREVLRDDVRLTHAGARVSDESSEATISWHEHYSWDKSNVTRRDRIERVLFGCYVNGSTEEAGPLLTYPRKFNDPPDRPHEAAAGDWPGQVVVEAPPGSVVIFDTMLWHNARRGTKPGHRYLWGAHCQGWSDPRPHPEDNIDEAQLRKLGPYFEQSPGLRRMVLGDGR